MLAARAGEPVSREDLEGRAAVLLARPAETRAVIDRALREVVLADPSEAPAGFDRLRRDYPPRREVCGSRVSMQSPSAASRGILRGLGCLLQEHES